MQKGSKLCKNITHNYTQNEYSQSTNYHSTFFLANMPDVQGARGYS